MILQFGPYRFRPRLVPTLAVAILIPLFLHLGAWQAGKARLKAELQARLEARLGLPPQDLPARYEDTEGLRYLRVRIQGSFDGGHTLLLDNQIHKGRAGFHVITPLRFDDGRVVLVNRGWVPFSGDRRVLPVIRTPAGRLVLTGHLWPIGPHRLDPAYLPKPGRWETIWQALDLPLLNQFLGGGLLPVMLRLEPGNPGSYALDWEPPDARIGMHRSYALQWRVLAAALGLAWLMLSMRRNGDRGTG